MTGKTTVAASLFWWMRAKQTRLDELIQDMTVAEAVDYFQLTAWEQDFDGWTFTVASGSRPSIVGWKSSHQSGGRQ